MARWRTYAKACPLISIFYAPMWMFASRQQARSARMIPIVTSQAIALGKAKQGQARPAPARPEPAPSEAAAPVEATAPVRRSLLRRLIDALFPPRPRRTAKSGPIED
jgi:hypothetical protein